MTEQDIDDETHTASGLIGFRTQLVINILIGRIKCD